jgi:hypothetical protein
MLEPTPRQEGELGGLVGVRPANFRPGRGIELEKIWREREFKVIRAEKGQSGAPNQFLMLTWRLPGKNDDDAIPRNPLKRLVGAAGLEPATR